MIKKYNPRDLYTTMVNIFIDIGDKVFKSGTYSITETDIFKKYLGDNVDNDIILQILKEYQIKI
jgi:hypothetical protein